jgi:hypothetical protein
MLLLIEGYISNFTRARYYYLCVECSDFYDNQSLAGHTIQRVGECYMFTKILNFRTVFLKFWLGNENYTNVIPK